MEIARYKPGAALSWLESGADRIRESSLRKARGVLTREGSRSMGRDVRDVASALWDAGSAALAELARRQAEATQYVLEEDSFSVVGVTGSKRVPYDTVKRIEMEGERCTLIMDRGSVVITPFAHLVAGRVRVPIGWQRNGTEVPYELLIEELEARTGKEVIFV